MLLPECAGTGGWKIGNGLSLYSASLVTNQLTLHSTNTLIHNTYTPIHVMRTNASVIEKVM